MSRLTWLLVILLALAAGPCLGDDWDTPKGPVRTVRAAMASFSLKGGKWVETDRHLYSVCQYDRQGHLTEQCYYDERSRLTGKIVNRYDSRGRKIEAINISYSSPQPPTRERTTYAYDKHGRLIRETYYDQKNRPSGTRDYTYDAKGHKLTESSTYRPTDTFEYNAKGQLIVSVGHDTRGVPEPWYYRYDARGNLIEESVSPHADGGSWYRFTYDAQNRPVTKDEGVGRAHATSRYTTSYDTQGRVAKETRAHWTGEAAAPASDESKWSVTEEQAYEYRVDARGNVVERLVSTRSQDGRPELRPSYVNHLEITYWK